MKPTSPDGVLDLMDASFASAALGAAMELGLFWLLDSKPLDEHEVACELGIPPTRCHYWLQLLCAVGLLERDSEGYRPSAAAHTAILEVYSQESWSLLAQEARERLPSLCDLPSHLHEPGSVWQALGLKPPMYLSQMTENPDRARRFTRMLYELHQPLAEQLAGFLDLGDVARLMDLGGGSGVVSLALLGRFPDLRVTVLDIENVCAAGREIAAENSQADRITYHPCDFLCDDLPTGFDVVLECDVNVYSEDLFRKVWKALDPGGRFVVVDQLAPAEGIAPLSRLHWAFEGSLASPDFAFPTAAGLRDLLTGAGFKDISQNPLPSPAGSCRRMTQGMMVIEAYRPRC